MEYVSRFNLWYYIPPELHLTFIILFFVGLWENFKIFLKTKKKICIDGFMLAGFLIPNYQ